LKNVLVINNKDLLSGGVVSLLCHQDDFIVVNKDVIDESALNNAMEELRPDVVIVNESLLSTYPSTLLGWLKVFPETRLIMLDENENLLHIYEKKEIVVEQSLDLIATIRRN
jgi:DNA-binding NarL/FixJ family response regulator